MPQCRKCLVEKPRDEFSTRRGSPNTICKLCRSVASRLIKYRRALRGELPTNKYKVLVFNHYGTKCIGCGMSDLRCLSIDHINGDGNVHRRKLKSQGGSMFYRWIVRQGFPNWLQVLCMNCQFIKRHEHLELFDKQAITEAIKYEESLTTKKVIAHCDNNTNFMGVSYRRKSKAIRYYAQITVNRKGIYLGSFPSPKAAAMCYDRWCHYYLGDKARVNFPRIPLPVISNTPLDQLCRCSPAITVTPALKLPTKSTLPATTTVVAPTLTNGTTAPSTQTSESLAA